MKKNLFVIICSFSLVAAAQPVAVWTNTYALDSNATNQATEIAFAPDGGILVGGSSAGTNGDLDYTTVKYAPDGTQQWLTRYDSPNHGNDQLRGMVVDCNGNVLLTGTTMTVKLDGNGNVLWSQPYGGRAIAVQGTNVYVTGFSETNFATAKLGGSDGTNIWTQTYDYAGSNDVSQVIAVNSNGIVVVAGFQTWTASSGHGVISVYRQIGIIAYDSNGNLLWQAGIGRPTDFAAAEARAVELDVQGNAYVLGNLSEDSAPGQPFYPPYVTGRFNQNGQMVWTNYYAYNGSGQGVSATEDPSGNVYLTGNGDETNYDCTTIKLDTNGIAAWVSDYHGPAAGLNAGTAIALDSCSNVYVAGYSPGNGSGYDMILLKYDNNGNQQWVERYNGTANGDDIATGMVLDNHGAIYVTGYSATTNGGTEFVTVKYVEGPKVSLEPQPDGTMLLQSIGEPYSSYTVQASSDLENWLDLSTNTADTNGLMEFTDTSAPLFPSRYYRWHLP